MLISELSIYPPGSFVQLANGEYAVVTHRGLNQTLHSNIQPLVLSFANADGANLEVPVVRECNVEKYKVKETLLWDKPFPLSPEDVWELSRKD